MGMGHKLRPESTSTIAELEDCPAPDASIGGFGEPIEIIANNKRADAARTAAFVRRIQCNSGVNIAPLPEFQVPRTTLRYANPLS
jgi:hypothetical protein